MYVLSMHIYIILFGTLCILPAIICIYITTIKNLIGNDYEYTLYKIM